MTVEKLRVLIFIGNIRETFNSVMVWKSWNRSDLIASQMKEAKEEDVVTWNTSKPGYFGRDYKSTEMLWNWIVVLEGPTHHLTTNNACRD